MVLKLAGDIYALLLNTSITASRAGKPSSSLSAVHTLLRLLLSVLECVTLKDRESEWLLFTKSMLAEV